MGQPKVLMHAGTPQLRVNDPLARPVRRVVYLRSEAGGDLETLISRDVHNTTGQLIEQWDPRLPKPGMCKVHFLSGMLIKIVSVDAGWRVSLPGLAGEELQRWDQRGTHWHNSYDDQLRLIAVAKNDQHNVETFSYANASADPTWNRRGQMIKHIDLAGSLELSSFSQQGVPLSETRTIADAGTFISRWTCNPLGAALTQTDAGGHQQHLHYDVCGQLKQVLVQLKDHELQCVLQDAQYNAAGQLQTQIAGNGVVSQWTFDPANGRLCTLKSGKPNEALQQNLQYSYDPMGNILRIDDSTLTTVYIANQRVDGHRVFAYDSLYRLISASGFEAAVPNLRPGLPDLMQPIDPGHRYGYTENYTYDEGNNLTTLCHLREGNNFTQHMRIDPGSNRGVRWKTGDPEPVFQNHFDLHGNQLLLQEGTHPLSWNAQDQLEKVTLLTHSNGLADDEETYLYSQGERVRKRHVTHTRSMTHSREVLYLPGLDIHTRDDGRVLHVVTLPLAFGSVRCLHWVNGLPEGLEPDQLRYSLDDHLGSSTRELDRDGALISLEFYYPFGGTAWWAARSVVEADYKTIRYSGKEMDRSGLYYYGARYYAPWLQRWVSADPAGDVDGLNLFVMVANNPIRFVDADGQGLGDFIDNFVETPAQYRERKTQSAAERQLYVAKRELSSSINRYFQILGISLRRSLDAQQQILNHRSPSDFAASAARRTAVHVAGQVVAYGGGIAIGTASQALAIAAPGVGNVAGVALGFAAKKTIGLLWDYAAERTGASASVKFKASRLSPDKIIKKAEYKSLSPGNYIQQKYAKMLPDTRKGGLKATKEGTGTAIGIVAKQLAPLHANEISTTAGTLLGGIEIAHEIAGTIGELSDEKITKGVANLTQMIDAVTTNMNNIRREFETAGVTAMHTFSYFGSVAGDTVGSLQAATDSVVNELAYTRTMLRSRSSKFTAV
jgi:insecticidal toxin complex protein TccC